MSSCSPTTLETFQFGPSTSHQLKSVPQRRRSENRQYFDLVDDDDVEVFSHVSDDQDETYEPGESDSESTEYEIEDKTSPTNINPIEPHVNENDITKKLTRKMLRKPEEWARNREKRKRMEGTEYKTQKGKIKRARCVQDVACRCHYSCSTKISRDEQENILFAYLQLSTEELRWNFISKHVKRIEKKKMLQ